MVDFPSQCFPVGNLCLDPWVIRPVPVTSVIPGEHRWQLPIAWLTPMH